MTGWRLGYAVGPKEIIAEMSKIQQHPVSQATTFAMGYETAPADGAFYAPGWIRLSYAASMEKLKKAMGRIERVG